MKPLLSPYLRKPFVSALVVFWILIIINTVVGPSMPIFVIQGVAFGIAIGVFVADCLNYLHGGVGDEEDGETETGNDNATN